MIRKIKYLILINILFFSVSNASTFDYKYIRNWKYIYHKHNESSYQHAYCAMYKGIEEYENSDKTRVDCLTSDYAIEFDFANKWHEAIGQALHYALMTDRKPKVVLILDKDKLKSQLIYYNRVKKIGKIYGFDTEYISDEILNIDTKYRCQFKDCKCNNKKHLFNFLKVFAGKKSTMNLKS